MKKTKYIYISIVSLFLLSSCDNKSFIDDIYVEPKASFSIDDKSVFDVFESVHFTNLGEGQKFVIWPGDQEHVYGQTGNNGFACNADGTFSYSYQEPGDYTAVWIASSIKANGEIVFSVDSVNVSVKALNGGLTSFSLPRMGRLSDFGSSFFYESYGDFVTEKRIVCPIPYGLWPTYIRRTVAVKFALESDFATMYWESDTSGEVALTSESTTKVLRFDSNNKLEPQTFKVKTSSGVEESYEIAAVIIPEFTKFTINGVNATQTRDISSFNKFNMVVDLPDGTDLKSLIPVFTVMNNDANLIDTERIVSVTVDDISQTSGTSSVDFSSTVNYAIKYSVPGSDGYTYEYESYYAITVK
jgi:hypothetical protein